MRHVVEKLDDFKANSDIANELTRLHEAGFALVLTNGKTPIMKGWNKLKRRPSLKTLHCMIERNPTANVACVPGRSGAGCVEQIFAIDDDSDDHGETADLIRHHVGETHLRTNTSRGSHYLFDGTGMDLSGLPASAGPLDFKHGMSILMLPPSIHPKYPDVRYGWDGADPYDLIDVPKPRHGGLQRLIEHFNNDGPSEAADRLQRAPRGAEWAGGLFRGSRGHTLNWFLCRDGAHVEAFDELLAIAHEINERYFPAWGHEMLSDVRVVKHAGDVWKDVEAGKLEARHNKRCRAAHEADLLLDGCGTIGSHAALLRMKVEGENEARIKRGEPFFVSPKAMFKARTMGDWPLKRIIDAKNLLVEKGLWVLVKPHTPKTPALYLVGKPDLGLCLPTTTARKLGGKIR